MKNFVQNRSNISFVAANDYASGQPLKIGSLFGILQADVAAGETGVLVTEGVFTLAKGGDALTIGEAVDFDAASGHIVPATGSSVGIVVADAAADAPSVLVRI